MNILWLMADELRTSALGCYGGAFGPVRTPHLDALARRGVLFRNHWCNSPVCVTSRLSMLTAQRLERTGVYSNEGAWQSYPLPVRPTCFPEHFARHGYVTASFGKEHLPVALAPWQVEDHEGSGMAIFAAAASAGELRQILPPGIRSAVGGEFPDDRPYPPEAVTRNAIDWLRRADDRPFLLRASWLQPHTPVLPPVRYRRRQRAEDWPGHDLPKGEPSLYDRVYAETVGGPRLSQDEMRQAQADYHALVEWLDDQVGEVLAALEASGRAAETLVVFNSDHGASLGENGLLSKVVFGPQSQGIPLILSWPGHLPEGEERGDLSEAMDLARTLCDLAGIAPDPSFEGRSLVSDPAPDWVHAVVGTGHAGAMASSASHIGRWPDGRGWPRRACVRSDRWRFDMNIRQDGGLVPPGNEDAFLADRRADPGERTNLAGDPAHVALVARLRAALLERAAGSLEPAFVPEYSPAEVGAFAPPGG